jgi:pyridoxamine--pyruvate transaminase
MRDPDFTLSAGPVAASPRVLAALGSPLVYHYDPVFLERFRATADKLKRVFLTENDVLLMQGEAVLGLEAAARGLVQPGTKVLNLVQGIFGKGMGYWLAGFGAELHELEVAYNDAVDPAAVDRYLEEHPGIELVTVVHSETPSGTVADVGAIGRIAHARGALTLADCVSSLGGMPLRTDEWQLDICVAGAQKCLGGPPGMTLMSVSDAAWARIAANPDAPRASYLSMLDWKEQWLEGGKFPFTPSVADLHGVEAAVDELLEEGLEESIDRHARAAAACRAGVRAMELELWPRSDEVAAACVTAVTVPDGLTDVQVRAHCRERYGVMISGGQGAGNLVRIGHMAGSARSLAPVVGLAALGRTLISQTSPALA